MRLFSISPLLLAVDGTFPHIDFGNGVPICVRCLNAMRFHPCPNNILLALADITEFEKIIPQRNHKASAYAPRKCPAPFRWQVVV